MKENLADIISFSPFVILIVLLVLYCQTKDNDYLIIILLAILVARFTLFIQLYLTASFTTAEYLKRPKDARNCYLWNDGGMPGFPSGHMSTATFLVVALLWKWRQIKDPLYDWVGVLYLLIMAWARLHKDCHTVLQIGIGTITGTVLAGLWIMWKRHNT